MFITIPTYAHVSSVELILIILIIIIIIIIIINIIHCRITYAATFTNILS